MLTYDIDEVENVSEKNLSLISYVGGYGFGTFYKRICCSTKNTCFCSPQCFIILMTRQCVGENVTLAEHKHLNIMDRVGLWEVNENVTSIFKITEHYFRIATRKHVFKIDC